MFLVSIPENGFPFKTEFSKSFDSIERILTVHILVERGWSTRFRCAIGRIQWRMGNVLARPSPVMMMTKGMCLNCRPPGRPPDSCGHRLHSLSPSPCQRPSLAPPWTDRHPFVSHRAEAVVFLSYRIKTKQMEKNPSKNHALIIFVLFDTATA